MIDSADLWAAIALAFLAGGLVKGVLGIGLPLVVVPAIATLTSPLQAIALLLVPALSSNVMQAYQAGLGPSALRRFWPACAAIVIGSWLGSSVLIRADDATATAVVGFVVVLFCATQFLTQLPAIGAAQERWFTPAAGTASGFAGGLTGFFGLTLVPYLLALRLSKEDFVATVALLYLCGVSAMYLHLALIDTFTWPVVGMSAAASIPTLLGVWLGSLLRRRVSEAAFRRLLLAVLVVMALNLLRKAFF